MSWIYLQATGKLSPLNGAVIAAGYSGSGSGKNNPFAQDQVNVGPIPQGRYAIGAPFDSKTHGPFAMPLSPAKSNQMYGRAGFLMHGDSLEAPGCASRGCIIMPRATREAVWNSGDRTLDVISGVEVIPVAVPEPGGLL